jgi:hypothetical protein
VSHLNYLLQTIHPPIHGSPSKSSQRFSEIFELTIEDKYKIARIVLTEILEQDLVILEKYKDFTLSEKITTIDQNDIEEMLNNPYYWYPCNEILSISLTKKGIEYLDNEMPKYQDKISKRLRAK